jgi:hypothetical protein
MRMRSAKSHMRKTFPRRTSGYAAGLTNYRRLDACPPEPVRRRSARTFEQRNPTSLSTQAGTDRGEEPMNILNVFGRAPGGRPCTTKLNFLFCRQELLTSAAPGQGQAPFFRCVESRLYAIGRDTGRRGRCEFWQRLPAALCGKVFRPFFQERLSGAERFGDVLRFPVSRDVDRTVA